jgi:tetratricopeptide (TPR) repeat protein
MKGGNGLAAGTVLWLAFTAVAINITAAVPPAMDSLMTVWSDETQPSDERFLAFDKLYRQFYQQYPDFLLTELEKLRAEAQALNRPLILFEAFNRKGNLLNYQGKNADALLAYDQAREVAASSGDSLRMGSTLANRGNVYAELSDYLSATQQYTAALRIYESIGYVRGQRNVRMAFANVFVLIDNYELGKTYYEDIFVEMGDEESDRFSGILQMNMAWCEYKLGNMNRAEELYLTALDLFEKAEAKFHLASCYNNLAALCSDLGRVAEAKKWIAQGLAMHKELGATLEVLKGQLSLAEIQMITDAEGALRSAEAIQVKLLELAGNETKRDLYELLYRAYKKLGRVDVALDMHERYLVFSDSVQELKNHHLVLRTAYEKEMEHEMLAMEMRGREEKSEMHIQQLQTMLWLILVFMSVVAALVAYIFQNQKKHRLRREQLLAQIKELRTSRGGQVLVDSKGFELDRERIEASLKRALNETDWNVLNILLKDPTSTNAQIAENACLSVDGIGSSLRRMYIYFSVQETKYKKIALLHEAMNLSANFEKPMG